MGFFDRFKKKDDNDFSIDDDFGNSDMKSGFNKSDSNPFLEEGNNFNPNPNNNFNLGTSNTNSFSNDLSQGFNNQQDSFGSSFNNLNQNNSMNDISFSNQDNGFNNSLNSHNNSQTSIQNPVQHKHKSDLQRDIQLIISKLDTIKAMVETMNQRLTNLENKSNGLNQGTGHRSNVNGRYW